MNRIKIAVGVVLVLLVAGFLALNSYIYQEKQPNTPQPPAGSAEVDGERVTITGQLTCLPKVGSGAQTLECAIGLEADDGAYYGLRGYDGVASLGTGSRVEVTGTLSADRIHGPDGNRYDTIGVIEVETLTDEG